MIPIQVTNSPGNNQLLYFTSCSLTAGNRFLVYIGDRRGSPNLYALELSTGKERQLTSQDDGYLKAYVYFDGTPYAGFGKASVSMNPEKNSIYYIQGRDVMRCDLDGNQRLLCTLPVGEMTGFTNVSRDDSLLCVPTVDAEAFDVASPLDINIDKRVQEKGLSSYLYIINTTTGEILAREKVPNAWITHVQFSPLNDAHILYNHEWPGDCGIRRMWLFDGKQHIRLRTEGGRRHRDDWTCHEMWERETGNLIYHGKYRDGVAYIGRIQFANPDDMTAFTLQEIPLRADYVKYGHFTVSNTNLLVTDGYYQEGGENPETQGEWISILKPDWEKGEIAWYPLCRHGSNWDCQESHPHPVFNHASTAVYFTSNEAGNRAVYAVGLPEAISSFAPSV